MEKQRKDTLHHRFFRSMAGISISFMVVLLLAVSLLYYRYYLAFETKSAVSQLDYISGQFDYYLTSVANYSKSIIVNSAVQEYMVDYAKRPRSSDATEQLALKDQIRRIIQSTPFIHSVTIYSPEKVLLASTEPYPASTLFESSCLSSRGSWICVKKSSIYSKTAQIDALSFLRPFYNYQTGGLLGFLEISIPEEVISDIYQDKATETSHIFMTDALGTVRSSDGSCPVGQLHPGFSQIKAAQAEPAFLPHAIVFSKKLETLGWYITNEVDLLHFILPTLTVVIISLMIALFCIFACLMLSNRISHSITAPLDKLITHTRKIRSGSWIPVEVSCSDGKIGELLDAFNSMILSQEKLKNDLLEAQKMKTKISLDLLQQQVNPHFLYNTLDNICSLAELDEKETLIDIVMNLSAFYREALSGGKFYITIKDELAITEAYLHIMQIRYFNKFDFTIDCPDSLYRNPCLKLLLQPIVENSIYHGIKELEYKGLLEITVSEVTDGILFVILDNGVGFDEAQQNLIWQRGSGHFGISNIHQRIQLYYGTAYGLSIKNRPEGGCITKIKIGKEALKDVL